MKRNKRVMQPSSNIHSESLPLYLSARNGGYDLKIKVVPRASCTEIVGPYGDRLKIRVAAPPEKGKANVAIIKLLEAHPAVVRAEIIAGETSPEKTVYIECSEVPTLF